MRGEHRAGADRGERRVEVQSGAGDEFPDALEAEETGMPLVHVEHLGVGEPVCPGEGAHRADAADAGEDLLLDPVVLVAAVEPVGHRAQLRIVLGDVGVEQQQGNPPDPRDPHPGPQYPATGHRDPPSPAFSVSSRSGRPCGSCAG